MSVDASILILTYNQEPWVVEAVESALAQQQCRLELFISDDASTDQTWERIQTAISGYTGPHRITLNRNESNLGLAKHLNLCMEMIGGDIVIAAAGDDVSFPLRARLLIDEFLRSDALLVFSDYVPIGLTAKDFPEEFKNRMFQFHHAPLDAIVSSMSLYPGATGAWRRLLFDRYGDIADGCFEDLILGFRAALEMRVSSLPHKLVGYRVGVGMSRVSLSRWNYVGWKNARVWSLKVARATLRQRINDVLISDHRDRDRVIDLGLEELKSVDQRIHHHEVGFLRFMFGGGQGVLCSVYLILSEINRFLRNRF